jgi:lipid A 3-O-deacylase
MGKLYLEIIPACLILSLSPAVAFADSVFNVLFENDIFTNTDRHYTSGVMFNYVSGIDEGPRRLQKMGVRFPGIDADDRMHVSVSLGHEIYTPTDIDTTQLLEDDRPYAGHLYLATGFTTENPEEIETWRLSFGLVGPGARAEVVQNNLHRAIGSDEAMGWDHQLKNEFVASVAYEKKWLRLARTKTFNNLIEFDLLPHASGSIGTPLTYIGAGAMLRIGRGLDHDYGPPRVRPSLPVSQFYEQNSGPSWYFFAGIDTRYVIHNLFLDGNNFVDSHAVDREDFVSDLQAGFVWNNNKFRFGYTWIYRTREFVQQEERDIFGSLSISAHF